MHSDPFAPSLRFLILHHNVQNDLVGDAHALPAQDAHLFDGVFDALFDNALAAGELLALTGHFKTQKARVHRHGDFGRAAGLRAVADGAGENRQAVYHRVIDEDLVRPMQVGNSRRRGTTGADRSAVGGQVADGLLDAHRHQIGQHQGPDQLLMGSI